MTFSVGTVAADLRPFTISSSSPVKNCKYISVTLMLEWPSRFLQIVNRAPVLEPIHRVQMPQIMEAERAERDAVRFAHASVRSTMAPN